MRATALLKFHFLFFVFLVGNSLYSQVPDTSVVDSILRQARISFTERNYVQCRDLCHKVIEVDSTCGAAYILIGSAYISSKSSCFKDQFSQSMIFCLAVDKFEKAKSVDSSVVKKANEMIDVYSHYMPNNERSYPGPIEGDTIMIECWINEETTVRFSR